MNTTPTLPHPAAAHAGRTTAEGKQQVFSKIAALWRPRNAQAEPPAATVSRFAMQLIDLSSGKAYDASTTRPRAGTPVNGVAATATIEPIGVNNIILYTAKTVGAAGNSITVAYVISGTGSTVLSVAVSGTAITVTAGSACTAASVITAVNASAAAAALVTAAASGTVTGAIDAVTASALTGGVTATAAQAGQVLYDSTNIYFALADVLPTSTTGWKKIAHANL